MLPLFDSNDIIGACSSTYSQRGRSYQQTGRVLKVSLDPIDKMLFSVVEGSYGAEYHQRIILRQPTQKKQHIAIEGSCSCPVGGNCKHVAAVLFEYLESQPRTSHAAAPDHVAVLVSQLDAWQEVASTTSQRTKQPQAPNTQDHVIYLLQINTDQATPEVTVDTIKCRKLKKGGWGKPGKINLEHIQYDYNLPAYITPQDEDIFHRLIQQNQYGYCTTAPLLGDDGTLTLRRLIDTQRCYLRDHTDRGPISWGPSAKPTFSWQKGDEHQLITSLPEVSDNWLYLPFDPPYYLDIDTSSCGVIEPELEANDFLLLQQLPPIPAEQLYAFSRFLYQRFKSIPTPIELVFRKHEGAPTPVLTLTGTKHSNGFIHLASLQFAYGDGIVSPYSVHHQSDLYITGDDGDEWHIESDIDAEQHAISQLIALGLTETGVSTQTPETLEWFFSGESRSDSASRWHHFLEEDIATLEELGWRIDQDDHFAMRFETGTALTGNISGTGDWFEFGVNIKVGRKRIPLLPLVIDWLENNDLDTNAESDADHHPLFVETDEHQWLQIPRSVIAPVIKTLVELWDNPSLDSNGRLTLPRQQSPRLLELEEQLSRAGSDFTWQGGKRIRELAQKLKNFDGITSVAPPKGLNAELRHYQQDGLNWLNFLMEYGFSGILADDMGLGKTLQALAHLLRLKKLKKLTKPALIVAPTSLLSNWKREAERFTPQLNVAISHGPQRANILETLGQYDVIITSYALLSRDLDILNTQGFHTLILDEAQAIKNSQAQVAVAARLLKAKHRVCLTGTPMENHLGELWSLFHFLMPDFLGQKKRFNQLFRNPIEKQGDSDRQRELHQRILPFMLRRTKQAVASELPPKTEIIRRVELGPKQHTLYETIRVAMETKVRQLLGNKGLSRSHIEVLDALLKLRQVCCDPSLVNIPSAKNVKESAKLELLMNMVPELLEEGRKILIFSQFTSMLAIIEAELIKRSIKTTKLTGQTRKRDEAIDCFQRGDADVFLISLKAGGFGLNLTEADTVIHYDPWWNPAAESQATDRAHRIGQDKPVFVYKLITENTVEEKILVLQAQKRELADAIYGDGGKGKTKLDADQLLALFS